MKIENAKYNKRNHGGKDYIVSVNCIINGQEWSVPISDSNRFYAEIKKQVDAGELTIADAD